MKELMLHGKRRAELGQAKHPSRATHPFLILGMQARAWRAWKEGLVLQAVKKAELEQAVLFWRKHELLGAFRAWQGWTSHMQHLKAVALSVVQRICLSCQVHPSLCQMDVPAHKCPSLSTLTRLQVDRPEAPDQ